MRKIKDRFIGCLYGQAIGDALGLGTEFLTKEDVKNVLSQWTHNI